MKMRVLVILMALVAAAPAPASATAHGPPQAASVPADPHEHLDQILRRPMFQSWRAREGLDLPDADVKVPTSVSDWARRCGRAIGDFFDWLFRSRSRGTSGGAAAAADILPVLLKVVAWLTLGAGLIFVAVMIVRALGGRPMAAPTARVLSRQQVHSALELGDALALDSAGWLDEAGRLAAGQDFRAVYRALYLALLSGLHSLGKIEHSRNRTNWTYVRHYRGPAEERTTFAELTQLFDRVWYGRKDARGRDIEDLRRRVMSLTAGGPPGGMA